MSARAKTLPVTVRRKLYEVPVPVHLHIIALRDRIAALEAEKAEREAQEPVAYVTDEPSPNPEPIAWLANKRAGMKLYAAPPVPHDHGIFDRSMKPRLERCNER